MKGKWVLLVVAGLLSLWLASGLAYAQGTTGKTVVSTVGNLQVEFVAPDSGLVSGNNPIAVQLKDTATGQPVVQNSVRVEMSMDATDRSMSHGDMSTRKPVLVELLASKDVAGRYTGTVVLDGAGKWNAKVYVDAQRSTLLGVSVAEAAGPSPLIAVAGLAGLAIVAGAVVFVIRRKSGAQSAIPEAGANASVNQARLTFSNPSDK